MKRFYIIGFLFLLSADTFTHVCFKYASVSAESLDFNLPWLINILSDPWLYGAILGYLLSFIAWMTLLSQAPVGPSYAASHLDMVLVIMLSVWLFGEALTLYKIAGAILIILGVFCLAKGEEEELRHQAQSSVS